MGNDEEEVDNTEEVGQMETDEEDQSSIWFLHAQGLRRDFC